LTVSQFGIQLWTEVAQAIFHSLLLFRIDTPAARPLFCIQPIDINPDDSLPKRSSRHIARIIIGIAGVSSLSLVVPPLLHGFAASEGVYPYLIATPIPPGDTAQTIPLLGSTYGGAPTPATYADGFLFSEADRSFAKTATISGEISVYVVREGDTLSQIAQMFDVSQNTILWANDIPRANLIKPGMVLNILPISGVRHTVKKGDTLASIAKNYKGDVDEILAYNQIDDGLTVGSVVVIPNGIVPETVVAKKSTSGVTSGGVVSAGLIHPLPNGRKTQGVHGYNGVDIAAPVGTTVRAAAAGKVIISASSGYNGGYGQYVVIKHANGSQTLYAHLSQNNVRVGASVSQGQSVGLVGNTGRSTGPHLHFEVRGAKNPF